MVCFISMLLFKNDLNDNGFCVAMELQIMVTETPFRPREKLLEKQRLFQSIQRHTYLKGPMDKITSVAIPIALAASSLYMIVSSFPCWFSKLRMYSFSPSDLSLYVFFLI